MWKKIEGFNFKRIRESTFILFVLVVFILFFIRWLIPERTLDDMGPRAIFDSFFSLNLLIILVLISAGIGKKILNSLGLTSISLVENYVFSISLGLGVIAYAIMALGFLNLLTRWGILGVFGLGIILSKKEIEQLLIEIKYQVINLKIPFNQWGFDNKIFSIIITCLLLLTIIQALCPPTGVDGLIYHLQGPKLYLEAGKIYRDQDFTPGGFPFTIEMLFAVGMAFGSDNLSQLIHLTYTILLLLSTYGLGKRLLIGKRRGYSIAILLGMPILPIWASLPYIDMGWALYELLGLYTLILAMEKENQRIIWLSAIYIGLGISSKYLALGGWVTLGLIGILWVRKEGIKSILAFVLPFSIIPLIVGSPWYIKNWLWYQNPVYPFFAQLWNTGVNTGIGSGLKLSISQILLMPVKLFLDHERYAGVYGSIEYLNPLFLIIFAMIFIRKSKVMIMISLFSMLRFGFWVLTTPSRMRYLLPAIPVFSIMTAFVLLELVKNVTEHSRSVNILVKGLTGGLVFTTLIYSFLFFIERNPIPVVLGIESKEQFLSRELHNFTAIQYIREHLSSEERVMMLWDSRGYYCDQRCIPDYLQARWSSIVGENPDISSVTNKLKNLGVTHLLLDRETLNYKLLYDQSGKHQMIAEFFLNAYQPACTREIYADEWTSVYKLVCE